MHKFLLFLAFGGAMGAMASAARAQDTPPIEPDQQDFTLGTGIVPRGHIQLEGSVFATRRGPIREYLLGQTLVRVPVTRKAEIRATVPGYIIDRDLGFNGLDDGQLEARLKLGRSKRADYAVTFGTTLPTGRRIVAERRYQPQAVFAAQFALNQRTRLVANAGIGRPTEDGDRFTQSLFALSLRYDATRKLNLFGEVYGFNRLAFSNGSQKFVAGGAIYRVGDQTALYGRVGGGISNDVGGPDRLLQLGLARLF